MVSIGFDEVTGLNGLRFTVRSVLAGRIHQITRAAMRRSDLYMLHDAPGGVFVVLDEAPVGSLLPYEHVLLVAVQRVDGLWVLRGMRIAAYFSAMKAENEDAVKHGSARQALLDAQQMVGGVPRRERGYGQAQEGRVDGDDSGRVGEGCGAALPRHELPVVEARGWHGGTGHAPIAICCGW